MTHRSSNNLINSSDNRLSVQIALTGLSFLITNRSSTELIHFSEKKFQQPRTPEELLLEIDTFFADEFAGTPQFESVSVIYSNIEYTVVPSPLFNPDKASDYLKFNSKILLDDFIAYDELKERDLVVVYVPYVNINNYLFERFGSFRYYHMASMMLKKFDSRQKYSDEPEVFIHVADNSFDLLIQKKGELQLCNSYHFTTAEDFIYYILFAFEQLKVNPDKAEVKLLGNIEQQDSLHSIAYTYIRNISFYDTTSERIEIPDNPSHRQLLLKSL